MLVLAIRAWRKEGKNPYKVIRRFMILDERYGIDLDFYQKKKLYNKKLCVSELYVLAQIVATTKGITFKRAKDKIKEATKLVDMSIYEYYKKGYWHYTNYHLVELIYSPTKEEVIDQIGELMRLRLGITKENAEEKINVLLKKYNIPLNVITYYSLWKCSDEMIKRRLDFSICDYAEMASKRFEVSYDEAVERLEELQNLFGISGKESLKYYKKDNANIFREMDKIDAALFEDLEEIVAKDGRSIGELFHDMRLKIETFGDGKELYKLLGLNNRDMVNINTFILDADMRYLFTKYNLVEERKILNRKDMFASYFKEMYGREYWVNLHEASYDTFCEFLKSINYNDIIVKPINGLGGHGIKKISVKNKDSKEIYDDLTQVGPVIVEEFVSQHEILSGFGAGAVNTIRIPTIYENDKCKLLYAILRIGVSEAVDNFHSGGYVARVDVDTGIISGCGYTRNGEEYRTDPYSGCVIMGTQIPYWDDIVELVKKSSERIKSVGLIGWDIAVTKNGPILIEGNSNPMLALYEMAFGEKKEGHRYLLEDFLDEKEAAGEELLD